MDVSWHIGILILTLTVGDPDSGPGNKPSFGDSDISRKTPHFVTPTLAVKPHTGDLKQNKQTNSVAFSPRANYTD
jgi:hypothetical protein